MLTNFPLYIAHLFNASINGEEFVDMDRNSLLYGKVKNSELRVNPVIIGTGSDDVILDDYKLQNIYTQITYDPQVDKTIDNIDIMVQQVTKNYHCLTLSNTFNVENTSGTSVIIREIGLVVRVDYNDNGTTVSRNLLFYRDVLRQSEAMDIPDGAQDEITIKISFAIDGLSNDSPVNMQAETKSIFS